MNYRAVIVDRDGVLTDFEMAAAATYFAPLLPISLWERCPIAGKRGAEVGFPRKPGGRAAFFRRLLGDALADEFGLDECAGCAAWV